MPLRAPSGRVYVFTYNTSDIATNTAGIATNVTATREKVLFISKIISCECKV